MDEQFWRCPEVLVVSIGSQACFNIYDWKVRNVASIQRDRLVDPLIAKM